ncbi:hypothetical protein BY996DRAFT_545463 [Phakopsora pachyrhizi]|nr:hypothetical protein BY996DRAFT_3076240 [Phakopsora pachyrhizi]KAI8448303.1 hypothetical protein BY996DRAFT_545463 [Phakopsora pachyrhizi]
MGPVIYSEDEEPEPVASQAQPDGSRPTREKSTSSSELSEGADPDADAEGEPDDLDDDDDDADYSYQDDQLIVRQASNGAEKDQEEDYEDEDDDMDEAEQQAEEEDQCQTGEEEMEIDDDASSPPEPRSSPQTHLGAEYDETGGQKKPLVLKLKLGAAGGGANSSSNSQPQQTNSNPPGKTVSSSKKTTGTRSEPTAKRKYVRKAPVKPSTPRSKPSNSKKPNSIKRRISDEEDELAEDWAGSEADQRSNSLAGPQNSWKQPLTPSDEDAEGEDDEDEEEDEEEEEDDDDDFDENYGSGAKAEDEESSQAVAEGSAPNRTNHVPNHSQLTVRQRAKEYGQQVAELQSLPMIDNKKKKDLTEADRAMERAEKSRKRKHQNEKKLEDEKTETINRLLKGQAGKAGKSNQSKANLDSNQEDNGPSSTKANINNGISNLNLTENEAIVRNLKLRRQRLMKVRYVSSIRGGEYRAGLSLPVEVVEEFNQKKIKCK